MSNEGALEVTTATSDPVWKEIYDAETDTDVWLNAVTGDKLTQHEFETLAKKQKMDADARSEAGRVSLSGLGESVRESLSDAGKAVVDGARRAAAVSGRLADAVVEKLPDLPEMPSLAPAAPRRVDTRLDPLGVRVTQLVEARRELEPHYDPPGIRMSKATEKLLSRLGFYFFSLLALALLIASFLLNLGVGRAYQASMWALAATMLGVALAFNTRIRTDQPSRAVGVAGIIITICTFASFVVFCIGATAPGSDQVAMGLGILVTIVGTFVAGTWTFILWFPSKRGHPKPVNDPEIRDDLEKPNMLGSSGRAGVLKDDNAESTLAWVSPATAEKYKKIFYWMSVLTVILWYLFAVLIIFFLYDVNGSVQSFVSNVPPGVDRVPIPVYDPSTGSPSSAPTTPTSSPTKIPTSAAPTTHAPSLPGATYSPTTLPSTHPSRSPTTHLPSKAPSTSRPSTSPTTSPTTSVPTAHPTTTEPSIGPTSSAPSKGPTTPQPTMLGATKSPTTLEPTQLPTAKPTTGTPTTKTPTSVAPSVAPVTNPPVVACPGPDTCSWHIVCRGYGSPTVLIEADLGGTVWDYMWLVDYIGTLRNATKVCAYSRAGYGYSKGGKKPRNTAQLAKETYTLIKTLNLAPVVFAPHGLVGMLALGGWHRKYWDITCGLAFLDAWHPQCYPGKCGKDDHDDTSEALTLKGLCPTGWLRALQAAGNFYDPLGMSHMVQYLPPSVQQARYNSLVLAEFWQNYADELDQLSELCWRGKNEAFGKDDGVDIRILNVVAGNGSHRADTNVATSCGFKFKDMTVASRVTNVLVPGATHLGLIWQNASASIVGEAIINFVFKIRSDPPLAHSCRTTHKTGLENKKPKDEKGDEGGSDSGEDDNNGNGHG